MCGILGLGYGFGHGIGRRRFGLVEFGGEGCTEANLSIVIFQKTSRISMLLIHHGSIYHVW
jgi:hypothetical protein